MIYVSTLLLTLSFFSILLICIFTFHIIIDLCIFLMCCSVHLRYRFILYLEIYARSCISCYVGLGWVGLGWVGLGWAGEKG